MRVLVTGGAGFIGSSLARRMLAEGYEVAIVDDLSTGYRENIPPGAEFLELDLTRPESFGKLPAGRFDAVCHLAGQSSGAGSMENPHHDLEANAASTILLSQWCLAKGVTRFVFASSMGVYGDAQPLPVSEEARCQPLSFYGASKLAAEHALQVAARQGLQPTALRLFSVYGPGQDLGRLTQGIVSIYLAYLLKGVPVPITGSLQRFRDLIYIDDVVKAWLAAVLRPSTPSPAYNIGTGKPTTVRQLLDRLIGTLNLPADYPIQELPGSPADQFGIYADTSRAQRELHFSHRVELTDGVRKMVEWARSGAVPSGERSGACGIR
jgi:UDP-glucose 4-epimerase